MEANLGRRCSPISRGGVPWSHGAHLRGVEWHPGEMELTPKRGALPGAVEVLNGEYTYKRFLFSSSTGGTSMKVRPPFGV
jgi:hypothetical protein